MQLKSLEAETGVACSLAKQDQALESNVLVLELGLKECLGLTHAFVFSALPAKKTSRQQFLGLLSSTP